MHNFKQKIKQKTELYGLLFWRRHWLNYKDHISIEEEEEEEEDKKKQNKYNQRISNNRGWEVLVVKATRYGLDVPGFDLRWV
jgi:hypothetical protein